MLTFKHKAKYYKKWLKENSYTEEDVLVKMREKGYGVYFILSPEHYQKGEVCELLLRQNDFDIKELELIMK